MPAQPTYPRELLAEPTFLQAGFETCEQFRAWVLGLTPVRDNEDGPDTWAWVREHNDQIREIVQDRGAPPFGTYLFIYCVHSEKGAETKILATGSFFPDDRGVADRLGLKEDPAYLGILGFLQVRNEFRGSGLGTYVAEYRDRLIQEWVNRHGSPRVVYLFTKTPANVKIVERLGFVRQEQIVTLAEGDEFLYQKRYVPTVG
jgi:hypothetical protein